MLFLVCPQINRSLNLLLPCLGDSHEDRRIFRMLFYISISNCVCVHTHTLYLAYLTIYLSISIILVAQSYPTLCNPRDSTCLAPLSMKFSRQEYWSGQPFPFPGVFQTQGLNLVLLHCRWIPYGSEPPEKPIVYVCWL